FSALILMELLQGAATEAEFSEIKRLLEPVERIDLLQNQWEEAAHLSFHLRKKGISVSTIDVLLAFLAVENDLLLYTEDKHFEKMVQYSNLRLYRP
ncbi:MAG: PIN domain-containing protein, partial [bacterium]|nr:PIN domain-containing protein [bacterium]